MLKVIIVDDEPNIRRGMKKLIDWEGNGFTISAEAEDGLQALELYDRDAPDIVITDIKMPGMDGLQLSADLKRRNPNLRIIILSGYNDFSYAKEAIKYGINSYLLKPVDSNELINELSLIKNSIYDEKELRSKELEKREKLKDYFLLRLINGDVHDDLIKQTAFDNDISFKSKNFCVAVINIDNYEEFTMIMSGKDIDVLRHKIRNVIINDSFGFSGGYLVESAEDQFCIIFFDGKGKTLNGNNLTSITAEIVKSVNVYWSEGVVAGIGNIVDSPGKIADSYKNAVLAMEYRFYDSINSVFNYENIKRDWPVEWENTKLMNAIVNCNRKEAADQIDLLFCELKNNQIPLAITQSLMMEINRKLYKVALEYNGDWSNISKNKSFYMQNSLKNYNYLKLKDDLLNICNEICNHIEKVRCCNTLSNSLEKVIAYVNGHYNEQISLKKLANLFYVNSVYLGQLFKKETGEYFNDYVNKVRIENARKLIEDTTIQIDEITRRVGYSHIEHFYRNFKNIMGCNPGEYRKRLS
jgi:Response regulator containing CheY-like receiver domain and AraC-type DNA-binding domain